MKQSEIEEVEKDYKLRADYVKISKPLTLMMMINSAQENFKLSSAYFERVESRELRTLMNNQPESLLSTIRLVKILVKKTKVVERKILPANYLFKQLLLVYNTFVNGNKREKKAFTTERMPYQDYE
ncbi:hypothetical protein T01_10716 [Trichinella spiralis]|uniref:Uncharacterized protein n=1 Tax=Trichinella spiralis TaxID=6334 RepID=A0A0V1AT28_TRISP|nr:hypothetical protein T01_10716 [Trichinella spiralis]